jgi:hypothetical protein
VWIFSAVDPDPDSGGKKDSQKRKMKVNIQKLLTLGGSWTLTGLKAQNRAMEL